MLDSFLQSLCKWQMASFDRNNSGFVAQFLCPSRIIGPSVGVVPSGVMHTAFDRRSVAGREAPERQQVSAFLIGEAGA
jgi:hypothetical protein